MDVKNILPGAVAVVLQNIGAFTADARCFPKRFFNSLYHPENIFSEFGRQLPQTGVVAFGNDEHMPRVDGLNVHQRNDGFIFINDAGGQFAGDDAAKNAVVVHGPGIDVTEGLGSPVFIAQLLRPGHSRGHANG